MKIEQKLNMLLRTEQVLNLWRSLSDGKITTFKSLAFSKIDYVEKWLNKIENWLISKFVISQTGQQTVTRHILPNISRRKGNQTMKFSQLIEYNMRKVWWRS